MEAKTARRSLTEDIACLAAMLGGLSMPSMSMEHLPPGREPVPAVSRSEAHSKSRSPMKKEAPGESAITEDLLEKHVGFLASDKNEGRGAGGGKLEGPVTEYIETIWKDLGAKPGIDKGFRQPFVAKMKANASRVEGGMGPALNERAVAFTPDGMAVSVRGGELSAKLSKDELRTHNLVAIFEGSDPELKKEYIVVGAHMDHLGIASDWEAEGGDRIFNGADDNASGTSAVLAISKALSEAIASGEGPKRSVIVVLFSGEELGLLGSQFFVENPPVPLARIKGMINFDMIGRLDRDRISVCDVSKDGKPNLFHAFHDASGLGIAKINHDIDRRLPYSDQYPFYLKGIPICRFFEGLTPDGRLNPDYHRVSDHAETLDYAKACDTARFAYRHLMGVANMPKE